MALNPKAYSNSRSTAVSFDKNQQPKSILKTPSTSFPTALGSRDREHSPFPKPSMQPEEKTFTTEQANELSEMATAALQTLETSEKKQLKHDLAASQRELELSKNDNRNLSWRMEMYRDSCEIADRDLEDMKKRVDSAEAELKATRRTNDKLKDMLRISNEKVEKVQCELAIVREEKVRDEEITRGEHKGEYSESRAVAGG